MSIKIEAAKRLVTASVTIANVTAFMKSLKIRADVSETTDFGGLIVAAFNYKSNEKVLQALKEKYTLNHDATGSGAEKRQPVLQLAFGRQTNSQLQPVRDRRLC